MAFAHLYALQSCYHKSSAFPLLDAISTHITLTTLFLLLWLTLLEHLDSNRRHTRSLPYRYISTICILVKNWVVTRLGFSLTKYS